MMGKTIVSWSPVHGQGATTSNLAALSANFSLMYPSKNIITHTQLAFSSLESLFGKQEIAIGFEESGIAALERLARSKLLKVDAVIDYTETVYKNVLDILGGNQRNVSHDELMSILVHVLKEAYDFVWIDAHSGSRNELTKQLLKEADIVLVNLPQNRYVLDRFFDGIDFPDVLKGKDYIILLSSYDKESSFTVRKIKRTYKIKQKIFTVPTSVQFKDAANRKQLSEFFFRNQNVNKNSPNYPFIKDISAINRYLAKLLGVKAKVEDDWE